MCFNGLSSEVDLMIAWLSSFERIDADSYKAFRLDDLLKSFEPLRCGSYTGGDGQTNSFSISLKKSAIRFE